MNREATPQTLSQILRQNHDLIARSWAKEAQGLSGSRYQDYPLGDLKEWAEEALTVMVTNLETGSNTSVRKYSEGVTGDRLRDGFQIYEITEGLLLFKEVVLPIFHESYQTDVVSENEAITKFDRCLRLIISHFERRYSQAMHQQLLDEKDKRLAESESLQRTTTALLAKLTLDEVLEIVCTEVRKLTGATGSAVLLKEDEGWLRVSISTGEPLPALERLSIGDSLAGKVIQKGVPYVINDPVNQVQAYYRNPDLRSILVVPLRVKDINIGVIDVVNKLSGFSDDEMRIISIFADQAAIAIENARLHQQAGEIAIVEERQRLARELHDSVTQSLYSVTLFVDATRMALVSGNLGDAEKNLNELRNMAREAMLDMRLLIFELHPPILEQEGLVVAIQTRLESVETRSGVETELSVEGERRLPLDMEADLYRIVQEALNNVVKHSMAQKVSVDLEFCDNIFEMEIWDNGVGFDTAFLADGRGMGLRGMEERVNRIGGKFSIDSSRTVGTKITVEVKL